MMNDAMAFPAEKACPKCGKLHPAHAVLCPHCRHMIRAAKPGKGIVCRSCGFNNPADLQDCAGCGQGLTAGTRPVHADLVASAAPAPTTAEKGERAALVDFEATVRQGPGPGAPILTKLRKDARFEVLDPVSGGLRESIRIKLADKRIGYIDGRAQFRLIPGADGQDGGVFAPERAGISKGIVGGLVMMGIAAAWFFIGLAFDYLFYYPPILFVIGVYALLKGLVTGNVAGEKSDDE